MQWSTEQLEKRAKSYNRIYFNNEIEKPIHIRWSRRMYNADSKTNAYHKDLDNYHLIMLNVSYSNVSEEMMRSTLVHEMIHAWQSEHDPDMYSEWTEYQGHGPSFIKKCEELNAKFKFTYPLTRYTDVNKLANLKNDYNILLFANEDAKKFIDSKEYLNNE